MTEQHAFQVDQLQVRIFESRLAMGEAAARDACAAMVDCLASQAEANLIFAAAPSQEEFLANLVAKGADLGVDWSRINAFHMDEYLGLPGDAPQAFGTFLRVRLFDRLPFKAVHLLDGNARDSAAEASRYADLLRRHPVDIVCLGIGENGHIAFNDPPVADFDDPSLVKKVPLDAASREQQVNEGCFPTLDAVPTHALTLTIPALTRAARMFCMVPAASKAWAVAQTLTEPITPRCPATILRRHPRAVLYLDLDSAASLPASGWP